MNKSILIVAIAAIFASCNSKTASTEAGEAGEAANATEQSATYTVNTEESTIGWKGSSFAGGGHEGNISISEGSLSADGSTLTAGSFVVDMNTINNTDQEGEKKANLEGHLKNPDFFDIANHPTSKFEIVSVTPDSLTGNLTMRGTVKSISFPYFFQVDGDNATATATFSVDRTQWGVNHNSKSVFADIKDNIINDAIELSISLKATK